MLPPTWNAEFFIFFGTKVKERTGRVKNYDGNTVFREQIASFIFSFYTLKNPIRLVNLQCEIK
jgi:hypothetical protein